MRRLPGRCPALLSALLAPGTSPTRRSHASWECHRAASGRYVPVVWDVCAECSRRRLRHLNAGECCGKHSAAPGRISPDTAPSHPQRARTTNMGRHAHMGMSVTISAADEQDAEQILKLQYLCYQSEAAAVRRLRHRAAHPDPQRAAGRAGRGLRPGGQARRGGRRLRARHGRRGRHRADRQAHACTRGCSGTASADGCSPPSRGGWRPSARPSATACRRAPQRGQPAAVPQVRLHAGRHRAGPQGHADGLAKDAGGVGVATGAGTAAGALTASA